MSQSEILNIRHEGKVAILSLNRPDRRNALNIGLCRDISSAMKALGDTRVLVVTGEGSAFCAGADLDGVYGDAFIEALYTMLHDLTKLAIPVIAAVNGPAIGAGTQLAMACDLRVADERAKFAVPTAKNGMAVDAWTIRTLAKLAGHGPARRIMLAAETFDRGQAMACGLADRTGTLAEAIAWAQEIADLAPLALAHNKLVLNGDSNDDEHIAESFRSVWASEDVKEAALARVEKRAPEFQGR